MGAIRFVLQGAREQQPGMEEPIPADPPRIFWKSRRSGACCLNSSSCLQNLAEFKCYFFYPRESSSRDSSALVYFSVLGRWPISA